MPLSLFPSLDVTIDKLMCNLTKVQIYLYFHVNICIKHVFIFKAKHSIYTTSIKRKIDRLCLIKIDVCFTKISHKV